MTPLLESIARTLNYAVLNLNREDGGERKHLLIEMGDYFHTALLPFIALIKPYLWWGK